MTDENSSLDPLSLNTARLSISYQDNDADGNRARVRELLVEESFHRERRDSAVSLSSLAEVGDDETNLDLKKKEKLASPKKASRPKRRRSSNQSFVASSSNVQHPPTKKEKVHKRKLKKQQAVPSIEFKFQDNKDNKDKDANDNNNDRFQFRNVRLLILQIFKVPTGNKIKWCSLENSDKINTVCVCFAPGSCIESMILPDQQQLQSQSQSQANPSKSPLISFPDIQHAHKAPFLFYNFTSCIRTILPGSKDSVYSPLESIIKVPLTKQEKKLILDKLKEDKITIRDLLLTLEQREQFNYPLTLMDQDWHLTTKSPNSEGSSKIYALDCEFCKANESQVLTRISLLDFEGNVVFDELVKPAQEITDYVTKYSGITEEMLADVTTDLKDIQALFCKHVFQEDILVGHSLESDLRVMKILHTNIVDTSVVYEHNRGPPSKPSLKWLAKTFLDRDIQLGEGDGNGHSSIEDANTCLDLVKLKILEGKCFGTNVNEISIFERLKNNNEHHKSTFIGYDKRVSLPGNINFALVHNVSNDDEVVEVLKQELQQKQKHKQKEDEEQQQQEQNAGKVSNLIITELRDTQYNLHWAHPSDDYDGVVDFDVVASRARTNSRLQRIMDLLPSNSLFVLCSQTGSPIEMQSLQKVRRNFQKMEKDGVLQLSTLPDCESWDLVKREKLISETMSAREALMFIKVKSNPNPSLKVID